MVNGHALRDKGTRKYRLLYYLPEFITIGYLIAYGVAECHYYSNPILSELARQGLTTKGFWTENYHGVIKPVEHSMEAFKPWILPDLPPPDSFGMVHVQSRPLTPIETDIGGALVGFIPVGLKYSVKLVKHIKKSQ
jgi:hypothetical protein